MREDEKKKKTFLHPLVHSPEDHKEAGLGQPRAKSFNWVSYVGSRVQTLGPFSPTLPGTLFGSWIRGGATRT